MRIIVFTLSDPWAQSDGGTLRTRAFLAGLASLGHAVVAAHPGTERSTSDRRAVVLPSPPPAGERSASSALRRVKRYFVPMPTAIGARSRQLTAALRTLGDADLILISQLSAAQYAEALTATHLWLDHSDLWSAFARRTAQRHKGPGRLTGLLQARRLAAREVDLSRAAAVVSAAGAQDAELLERRATKRVTWLPTPVTVDGVVEARCGTSPLVAGLIGNFGFAPNRDALELLLTGWGPQLMRRGWQVLVAGHGSDTVPAPSWVRRMGSIDSPIRFYEQVDLALAPIRLGGGIKVKVIEALMYGRPVLASPFAMEGFPKDLHALVSMTDALGPIPSDEVLLRLPSDLDRRLHAFTPDGFTARLAEVLSS